MTLWSLRQDFEEGRLKKHDFIDQMHTQHALLFEYAAYLKGTDISGIEITDDSVVMTERASGIQVECDPHDKRIAPIETLNFGTLEGESEKTLYQAAEGCQVVFDIGANIGWYALNLAKRSPDAQVHAFEPLPETFRSLRSNVQKNGLPNIRLYSFGFSDTEQELTFYLNPESTVSASLADLTGSNQVQEVRCQVKRLDDFVAAENIIPDFIKCDVEGAELLVFQGSRGLLESARPIVFAEMLRKWTAKFGYHPNQIISLMREFGYQCFACSERGPVEISAVDEQTIETNFLFLHQGKHAERIAALRGE
jgi:FkbM family methyltransferase